MTMINLSFSSMLRYHISSCGITLLRKRDWKSGNSHNWRGLEVISYVQRSYLLIRKELFNFLQLEIAEDIDYYNKCLQCWSMQCINTIQLICFTCISYIFNKFNFHRRIIRYYDQLKESKNWIKSSCLHLYTSV